MSVHKKKLSLFVQNGFFALNVFLLAGCGGDKKEESQPRPAVDIAAIQSQRESSLRSHLLSKFDYDLRSLQYSYVILVSSQGLNSHITDVSAATMTSEAGTVSILNNQSLSSGVVSSDTENAVAGLKNIFADKLNESAVRANPELFYQLGITVPELKAGDYTFNFTLKFADGYIAKISVTQTVERDVTQ